MIWCYVNTVYSDFWNIDWGRIEFSCGFLEDGLEFRYILLVSYQNKKDKDLCDLISN